MKKIVLIVLLLCFVSVLGWGYPYWVSPTGTATWVNAESETPLSGTACCSLSTANSNVAAGNTVKLRAGNYSVDTATIAPGASGTSGSKITYEAHTDETVTFVATSSVSHAITIAARNYIIVDHINGNSTLSRWFYISNGASYNEIRYCSFIGSDNFDCGWRIGINSGGACTHNWIHHCTFAENGYVTDGGNDQLSLYQLGYNGTIDHDNNTIENNTFYYGGHDCGEVFTKYNVFKNNFWHCEGWMTAPIPGNCTYPPDSNGKYGNRNFQAYDGQSRTEMFCLYENNRFQASGQPPDDDGGDGFTLTAPKNIFRFNEIINAQNNGLLMKIGAGSRSDNNRIYNNTIVWGGRYEPPAVPQWQGYGIRYYSSQTPSVDNIFKNNLLYGNTIGDILHRVVGAYDTEVDNDHINNWLNADGDPLFVDDTHSNLTSKTAPDLALRSNSPCLNGGTYLTLANGSGSDSVTLIVDDALYFQDGSWGSSLAYGVTMFADHIAIGTVSNTVEIDSINYSTNTITLVSTKTWSNNDSIWLYKDSDGSNRLIGSAPEYGAHEYGGGAPPTAPFASNLTMLMSQIQIMPIFWAWYALVCFVVIRLVNKS